MSSHHLCASAPLRETPIFQRLTEPPQVGHDLHDLVAGLHDLRIELERPLRGDQVDQLGHRLDVRRLQKSLPDVAEALLPGVAGSASPDASVC